MPTGSDIIQNAFIEIGVFEAGEPLNPEDTSFGLVKLNRMLNSWAAEGLFAFFTGHATFTFGVSQQSYTIGPSGATFTATRPVKILSANVILVSSTPNARVPLHVINTDEYSDIAVPAQSSSIPSKLYYQATNPNGTLWPWPFPTDTANGLELFTWNQLAQIVTPANTYNLPPGYEDAITLSLAETLLAPYKKSLTRELERDARSARARIQGLNSESPKLSTLDAGMPGGRGKPNILTGAPR